MPYPDRNYPDRFYPVVDSVAWVARLALLGVGTIQLRAKDLNDSEALQTVSDALEVIKGTAAKLVVNDYWRAAKPPCAPDRITSRWDRSFRPR